MRQRRGWIILAVSVLVLIGGAGGGVLLRQLQATAGAAQAAPAAPTTRVSTPAQEPRTVVLVEDVAAHPDAERVRALLQNHFDAINDGNYALWTDTVTRERARGTARSVWRNQYRTTVDTNVVVHRLEPRPGGGLTVLLSFNSAQELTDAPPDLPVTCLRWRVSYALVDEAGELRLTLTSPSASLRTPC